MREISLPELGYKSATDHRQIRRLLVEREGNDPTSSGVSDQRSDLISYLSIFGVGYWMFYREITPSHLARQ